MIAFSVLAVSTTETKAAAREVAILRIVFLLLWGLGRGGAPLCDC